MTEMTKPIPKKKKEQTKKKKNKNSEEEVLAEEADFCAKVRKQADSDTSESSSEASDA